MSETDKRTASQRIEDLESVVTQLYQNVTQMANVLNSMAALQGDMALIRDALRLLNKKTEAIIQVAKPESGVTVASVQEVVVSMNVNDLTAQVKAWIDNGSLVATDTVTDTSFVVVEELQLDGTVASPRTQFRVDSQDQTNKDLLRGSKVGDVVPLGENKFSAKILEIYSVVDPKAQASSSPTPADPATVLNIANTDASNVTETSPAAPTGPSNANFEAPPAETPVEQFVPSDSSTLATAQ